MTNQINPIDQADAPKLDSLIEDVFGLNVRGLKTLVSLFTSPKNVFESARVSDWRRKYTPTIRLTFSILTVYMLLSFFWAAEDGAFYQFLLAQIIEIESASDTPATPEQIKDMVNRSFAAFSFLYPFIYMVCHGLFASCIFMWGKNTGWVTRIRLYFCLLVGGISISLVTTMILPLFDDGVFMFFATLSIIANFLTYVVIYLRGMWGYASTLGLLVRAFSLALLICALDLTISLFTAVGAGFWVNLSGV